jgi:hypothetical protein
MEYQKMKFKFKVGDRVRYVEAGRAGVNNGDIVTVTECDGSSIPYKVENENKHCTWAYADDVEAMEAQPAPQYIVDTTSPIKVGDKIRILEDGYNCIQKSKVGHIFVIKDVSYSYRATCDQIEGREDTVWSITPEDRGTGWELVREEISVRNQIDPDEEIDASYKVTREDAAPLKSSRRLKYGRRRMAFEFAKALLSNPALERSYLDTPEALASVADTIALELIKRWKEVE